MPVAIRPRPIKKYLLLSIKEFVDRVSFSTGEEEMRLGICTKGHNVNIVIKVLLYIEQ